MIRFGCSNCGAALAVPDNHAGTIGSCASCRNPYTVPGRPAGAAKRRMAPVRRSNSGQTSPLVILFLKIAGYAVGAVCGFYIFGLVFQRSKPPAVQANYSPPPLAPITPPVPMPLQWPPNPFNVDKLAFDPPPRLPIASPSVVKPIETIKTERFLCDPERVYGTVYFGTRFGEIYAVDAQSLDVQTRKLAFNFSGFHRDGKQFKAATGLAYSFRTIAEFKEPIEPMDPQNVYTVGGKLGGYTLPDDWRIPSPTVLYEGRYYSCDYGQVKIFEDGKVTIYRSNLEHPSYWKIALLPSGPTGYDNRSVFKLDEHLCPIHRIIHLHDGLAGDSPEAYVSSSLASDGKTLCFVSTYRSIASMQIWSLRGRQKLAEIPVSIDPMPPYNGDVRTEGNRIAVVAGGYLFSGGELTWLSADGKPKRFELNSFASSSFQRVTVIDLNRGHRAPYPQSKNFTPPLVTNDRIFVGHVDGTIYVFAAADFAPVGASTNP